MTDCWGYHAMIEAAGCDIDAITDAGELAFWVDDLVRVIDMESYGDPIIKDFANHDPTKGGFTVMQMISTSSITAHFVAVNGDAYIDIFSCKPFNLQDAMDQIQVVLTPRLLDGTMFGRKAPTRAVTELASGTHRVELDGTVSINTTE